MISRLFAVRHAPAILCAVLASAGACCGASEITPSVTASPTPPAMMTVVAGQLSGQGYRDGPRSSARLSYPAGLRFDSAGNLYVADGRNNVIRRIDAAGIVTTVAGAVNQSGSADGSGAQARFSYPGDIAIDAAGDILVADAEGNAVRKMTPAGVVTTIAGGAGNVDDKGSTAAFKWPERVAIDAAGNRYTAEGNSAIRRTDTAGVVTTWAGAMGFAGSLDGAAASARFNFPNGIAIDGAGNVYIADQDNSTIRKLSAAGLVSTVAGSAGAWGAVDATGSGARFGGPGSVAVMSDGSLVVSEFSNHTIRKVAADGKVTTLAGAAGQSGSGDGQGAAARFNGPNCVAVDRQGNVYVADYNNNAIRRISPTGAVTTIAGGGKAGSADGSGSAARFNGPNSIAIDDGGNLLITDSGSNTVRKMTPGGVVSTLAGSAGVPGSQDGTGTAARFSYPWGVALDRKGNLYVADSGNNAIRKVTPAGAVTTIAGGAGAYANVTGSLPGQIAYPIGLAYDDSHQRLLLTLPDAVLAIPLQ